MSSRNILRDDLIYEILSVVAEIPKGNDVEQFA